MEKESFLLILKMKKSDRECSEIDYDNIFLFMRMTKADGKKIRLSFKVYFTGINLARRPPI